ncbi:hypothetical protein H8N03_06720 [Ramlibacter sp. USB13]|uniref:Uncharacterized protein n=1 Tax=Ramlibacter cellulosilyticus TaxID=2764187 RepID=A0A923MRR9_9BURK|nr:hypothetical protein [Ramlibacter cellulosilyticus]MBC5782632.1 hypothetical protein [Ramlibacter cellulosilyticus]
MRVAISADAKAEDALLRLANDANRRGWAAVHCDLPTGTLVVQQSIVYTGYHDVPGLPPDAGMVFAQREATLNMLVAVFSTCATCLELLQSGTAGTPPALRRIAPCPIELLQPFSVFVLSRLVRWDLAELADAGPAWVLVRDAALRCMRDGASAQAQERVDGWLRHRADAGEAEAAMFDGILFDVDRSCRWVLRDVMADPPDARPLRQLMLLEQALAVHAGAWQSVRLRPGSVRDALAKGLDLPPARVPETFVDRLLQRFPFLAPRS